MRLLWRSRARRRVEDFARGVDDAATPDPAESSTSRLVAIAHAVRSVPLPKPPELTLAVRRRIVNAARASEPEEPRPLLASLFEGFRLQRGLASTTVLLTAAVALVSIGFGTSQALPGDTLYGLKLRGESITIALARSDEARGHSYLKFAGARLRDVSGLIEHDGAWRASAQPVVTDAKRQPEHRLTGLVNSTLTTMNGYTDRGADALRRAYQRTGDTAPLAYLNDFTEKQGKALSRMMGKLPAGSQSVAGKALSLVDKIGQEADKLLNEECGHLLTCQSEPRPGQTSPSDPVASTPTEAPATSLTSDIQTSGAPKAQDPTSAPQRTPSTSQQPGTTATPPGTDSSSGSQSTDSTPPSTESSSPTDTSSSGGDTTKDAPTGTDAGDTGSTPAPTGVPSSPDQRSADSVDSASASDSGTTSAPDGSGSTTNSGSTDSTDSSAAPSGSDTSTDSGDSRGSGTSAGSDDAPASRPVESRDPSRPADQTTPSDTSADQTTAEATPAK